MDIQYVLLVGDDLDENMITIGPFAAVEDAAMYAQVECRNKQWRIAKFYPVRTQE